MAQACVYQIFDSSTGKIYIGKTKRRPKSRYTRHQADSKKYVTYLYNAIRCRPDAFEFKVIGWFKDELEALKAEKYWISFFDSTNPNFGYNNLPDGIIKDPVKSSRYNSNNNKGRITWMKGKKHTEESKRKNSLSNMGRISPRKGAVLTEEIKNKISQNRSGKYVGSKSKTAILNEEKVIKIRGLLLEGNLKHREIAILFGVTRGTITSIRRRKTWNHI